MGAVTKVMDQIGNAIDHVFNALDPAFEAIGSVVEKVISPMANMFANAVEHPLETIITAAAASIGIPSYVTSAAITAAKGGSLEDIAKSAAMSYASTEFMSQTNIGAEINKVVGSAGGDFTDSMMKTFDLTPDQAVQLAKVSTAALNSSVMGGIKSALNGDSIAGGMASGFQSGLVYGSTDSFFSSINKDQNWGLSPTALNLVKGASSTALNTIISGKGDPAQAIGNYLGGAMINLGSSEFSKLAKSSYENLTGKVTAAQAAQDKYTALQDTYKAKVADSEEARTTINKTVEQINAIKTAEVDPIIAKITAAETDQNAANVEYYANKATYDKNKAVVDNYNDEMIKRGFAAHDDFADGVLQYYKEEASDGENSPTRIYAPGIETFYNDQKAAAVAANAAATKSNNAAKTALDLTETLKPIQDKLTPLEATIASKTEFFNAIKADIETPAGNNLAAQMAAAANKYQIAYTEFQTAQTSANKAAENSAKQIADVAVRDVLIGAVGSGAITVTGKDANGAYTLSNGMTIDSGGKFFQDGVPAFIDAAGVKQAPLNFTDNAGNKVSFNADAGRVMSTTDVQNALKRDYNITATEDQAKTLAGKPFTDVSSAEMKAFAEANGFQKVTPGDGIDPATGALHLTLTGTSTSGSNADELSKDTINGLLSIGQSAKPPTQGGRSLFGEGSASQAPNALATLGIPSLLGVDDASGTSFSMTSNGYALITYSDGHSVAIDPKTQEPIWVNLADTKNALSGATDTDTKALASTINAITDPTIVSGIQPLPGNISKVLEEEIAANPTLKLDDIQKIVVAKLAADPNTTPEQVRVIIRGLATNQDLVDKAVTDTKTGTTIGTATGTATGTTGTTTAAGTSTGTGTTTTAGTGTATGTTQTTATTGLTPEQVTKIVNDAIAANPSLTAEQVRGIVSTALASNPGVTIADVQNLISKIPAGVTTAQVQAIVNTSGDAAAAALNTAKEGLTKSIADLASGTTTSLNSIKDSITALTAAGLTTEQVEALVSTGTTNVESKLKTAIADAATTQSTALDTAKSDLTKAIGDLSSKTTTDMAGVNAAIAALAAAGLTTDQVQKIVDTSSSGVTTDLKAAITAAGTAQTTALNNAKTELAQSITDLSNKTTTDMTSVNKAIADLKAAGLTTEQVNALINTGTANVTTDLKAAIAAANTAQATALDTAKADLTKAIGDLSSKTTTDTADLKQAISDLRAAGLTEAQVKSIVETQTAGVSTDVKAAITDAATGMTTALEKAKTDLSKSITDLASGTATGFDSLKDSIAALKASGLTEAQVQKLVDAGSANVSADLKAAIATASTEQSTALNAAKASLTKSIADLASGTSTGFETLNKSIADLKAAGLTEAQVKALVDAGTTGVTTDLKAAIKIASEAATTQIAGVTADVQAKYDAMTAAQKAEVAARQQQGIDLSSAITAESTAVQAKLAALGTDVQSQYNKLTTAQKEEVDARSLQGTTLAQAIADAAQATKTQITGVSADFQAKLAASDTATQQRFNQLTAAQKAQAEQLSATTGTLQDAIAQAAATTTQQIAGVSADFQAKLAASDAATQAGFGRLTDAQKAQAEQLATTTGDLKSAIAQASAATTQQIAGVSADFQAKLAASDQATQDRFNQLTDAQKAQAAQLATSTGDLQTAIAQAAETTTQQIAGLTADMQSKYDAMTATQKADVAALQAQGRTLQDAIASTAAATQAQITGLSADLQAKYDAMTAAQKTEVANREAQGTSLADAIKTTAETTQTQITNTQTQFNTRVDQLVTQGQTQQAATDAALKELNAGILGIQTEQQAAKDTAAAAATESKRAAAQTASNAGLAAAMGILGGTVGAVGQIGSKTAAAPVIDETIPAYKKIGFTSTGDTAKYVSPLEQYLKQVMGDSYANPQQQAAPVNQAPQQPSSAFSYGQETNIDDMLASSTLPEMGNYQTSMYSSKKGGLVPPLMAAGGSTRYGKYAGGGLNTVNFQGKDRIDFRTGNAVTGPGDGQSDDIPAMLADGEFVFPADVVAALGNGSTKAGSDKLYDMMHSIRSHSRSTSPKELPPPAKSPLDYLNKRARR